MTITEKFTGSHLITAASDKLISARNRQANHRRGRAFSRRCTAAVRSHVTFRQFHSVERKHGRTTARAIAVWIGVRSMYFDELVRVAYAEGVAAEQWVREAEASAPRATRAH